MSILKRLAALDRRLIYAILLAAICIVLFKPLGIPTGEPPSELEMAVQLYQRLASLPEGAAVLFSADFDDEKAIYLKSMTRILLDLSAQKKHRIVLMGLWPGGCDRVFDWTQDIFMEHGYVYGTDYLNLGYIPDYDDFLQASLSDFYTACGAKDYMGEDLSTFPIMENISKARDFRAIISLGHEDPGYSQWLYRWQSTLRSAIFGHCDNESILPGYLWHYMMEKNCYVASGPEGAAILEQQHDALGSGQSFFDAQSAVVLVIIFFVVLGNISIVTEKIKKIVFRDK